MPPHHRNRTAALFAALGVLLMVAAQGCQTPPRTLDPDTLRASAVPEPEQQAALQRWQLAIDLANEFLASSFNRTLPGNSHLRLESDGMQFVTEERTMPVKVVIIDDYRTSSCVCATVDTYKKVVYAYRPWGAELDLPIETCNTFFSSPVSAGDEDRGLAAHMLRMTAVLFFEKHTHISTWEWFKCQYLEWLIGSGHHKFSMRRTDAVFSEFTYFWNGVEPATPTIKRILWAQARSQAEFEQELAERNRSGASIREQFEEYLREREARASNTNDGGADTGRAR